MSYAPESILAARLLIRTHVPQLSWVELGIVGDAAHSEGGDSYHLGKDQLRASASYSVKESPRDGKPTDAASALDVGRFTIRADGGAFTDRDMVKWIVAECKAGTADTKDFREIIYTPDGSVVRRWDRLGVRSTGDTSHFGHSHYSWFRDSEGRDKTGIFRRWFEHIGAIESEGESMIPCQKGDTGQHVTFWQYALNRLEGAGLEYDGVYGPAMEAAVNAYRTKWAKAGPNPQITGWMAYHMLIARGGVPGPAGKDGTNGKDGKDGTLSGVLSVEGGTLNVRALNA